MTTPNTPPAITLPAATVIQLAELLTRLDEFFRSGPVIAEDLARFLASQGDAHAGFSANNLIDDVSFTAAHLRTITSGIDENAAEYARLSGHFAADRAQD